MSKKNYDVLIIGGGINGAAIAHDAALRGLDVALVEKKDFGSGTTSASSKLAHGGLRYLKNFEIGLVRESLRERRILEMIAPHLVYPLKFIIPIYKKGPNRKIVMRAGMTIYDLLSFDKGIMKYEEQKIPSHEVLTAEELLNQEPLIMKDDLLGGVSYYDCQISSPERLCLEYILTAASNGADVANYAEVKNIKIKDNKVSYVNVEDKISKGKYRLNAKTVINASGPWLDRLIKTYDKNHEPLLRGTKGIHIITHKISNNAVVLTTKKTKRNFFIEPWRYHSLIGTTDVSYKGNLDNVMASKKDVKDLVKELNEVYSVNINVSDVKHSYAGIRPLINEDVKKETKISRKYDIMDGDIEGLITIIGGKITTARSLAENTVNLVFQKLGKKKVACKTKNTPLHGSTTSHKKYLKKNAKKKKGFEKETIEHLINIYGSRYEDVLNYTMPWIDKKICPSKKDIKSQIIHAIKEEMTFKLDDFMLRRSGLGTLGYPGDDCTKEVADRLESFLGKDKFNKAEEIIRFKKKVKKA